MEELNIGRLAEHLPDNVVAELREVCLTFSVTTNLRLAHFLAQCSHESGHFRAVTENLNYSAVGLKKVFPKYFIGNLNELYARKPEKIANRVYASRMGNGNEASGDGYRFRGRGFIQLTGRANYAAFDRFVPDDILSNPDLVASKYPLSSAAFFFERNSIWKICDKGDNEKAVEAVTRKVNGGTIGLADRIIQFSEYYSILR